MKTYKTVGTGVLLMLGACHLPEVGELPIYEDISAEFIALQATGLSEDGVSMQVVFRLNNPNDEPFPLADQTVRLSLNGVEDVYAWSWRGGGTVPADGELELTVPLAVPGALELDEAVWDLRYVASFEPEGALRETLRDTGLPRPSLRLSMQGEGVEERHAD